MKSLALILAAIVAAALVAPANLSAHVRFQCDAHEDSMFRGDNVSVEWENGSLIYTDDDSDETVEITEKAELFVNGKRVTLTRSQRELVEGYYRTFEGVIEEAKAIGIQGAKIGARGAALGLKAAIGVLLLISPDYDTDDLEDALDEEGEKLDRLASKLEKRAKRLERKAEKLERLHDELREKIDELDDLGWF